MTVENWMIVCLGGGGGQCEAGLVYYVTKHVLQFLTLWPPSPHAQSPPVNLNCTHTGQAGLTCSTVTMAFFAFFWVEMEHRPSDVLGKCSNRSTTVQPKISLGFRRNPIDETTLYVFIPYFVLSLFKSLSVLCFGQ